MFGSVTELRARYGVTEAVLRQAVLLLEEKGISFSRRGVGGGIIVGAPDNGSAARTAAIYLQSRGVTAEHCALTTRANHWLTALSSKEGLSLEAADYLRAETARLEKANFASEAYRHLQLRTIIAASAGGPVLALSTQVVNQLLVYLTDDRNAPEVSEGRYRLYWEITQRKLEAFIAGDVEASLRAHDENVALFASDVRDTVDGRGGAQRTPPQSRKAEWVVGAILRDIRNSGWRVGDRIGSEPQLMQAYGVSRPVIRQAARLLELHRAASMQRGARGGLTIGAPDAGHAMNVMIEHLQDAGTEGAQARPLRREILLRHVSGFLPAHVPRLKAALHAATQARPATFWAMGALFLTEVCRGADNTIGSFLVETLREFEFRQGEIQPPSHSDGQVLLRSLEATMVSLIRKDHPRAQRALIQYAAIEDGYAADRSVPAGRGNNSTRSNIAKA